MHSSCQHELTFPHFIKIVVKVKASGPPHALKLRLEVSKGMLPVKYFCPITVVGSKQGHAPVKYFCLITVVGSKQGHAPFEILLSYNCGWE